MKKALVKYWYFALLGALACPGMVSAQFFSYGNYGNTLLGFRKTGTHQGTYELVVNIGYITNFLNLPAGASISITQYSPSQLSDAFADGYSNLQWSVSAAFAGSGPWGAFPKYTVWYSLPAPSASTQSTVPTRFSVSQNPLLQQRMLGLGHGAATISAGLGATNQDNNAVLVREPYDPTSLNDLTYYIGDAGDPTFGDWYGQVLNYTTENTTPAAFTSPARLDLYQSAPSGYVDPNSGSTGPAAYFVGYFLLNPSGTMTFTRASAGTPPPPPPPKIVSVSRAGNVSTIYFTTTNGANYTLYFTNSAGLTTALGKWPSSSSLVGNGGTNSLTDTTTDTVRFYRVGAR